jgi:hypothetical protein
MKSALQAAIYIADILDVVHRGDRGFSISFLAISDKSKSAAAAGIAVLDDDLRNYMR